MDKNYEMLYKKLRDTYRRLKEVKQKKQSLMQTQCQKNILQSISIFMYVMN